METMNGAPDDEPDAAAAPVDEPDRAPAPSPFAPPTTAPVTPPAPTAVTSSARRRSSAASPPIPHAARPVIAPSLPEATADERSVTRPQTRTEPSGRASAAEQGDTPRPGTPTWYRSEDDRDRSVFRRANPWYRQLARWAIGLTFVAALGAGLVLGARVVRDYLERDRLPAAGVELPEIRATTFLVAGASPAPELDGTLTTDAGTGAFEYVGRAGGPQSGVQVVSTDGADAFIRFGLGDWRAAQSDDAVVDAARRAAEQLASIRGADDILTTQLRRGYTELLARVEEGTGSHTVTRYELSLDTNAFSSDHPLQWEDFRQRTIPGIDEGPAAPITIWLDADEVLVRFRSAATNWSWERLTYSDQPFVVGTPSVPIVPPRLVCATGEVVWRTTMSTCDDATKLGRALAVAAGATEPDDTGAADTLLAAVCSAMELGEGPLAEAPEVVAFARALAEIDACVGDPDVFVADAATASQP